MPISISAVPMPRVHAAIAKLSGPVRKKVDEYVWIMTHVDPLDPVFQKKFEDFYVMGRKTATWKSGFYDIFNGYMGKPVPSFSDVLDALAKDPRTAGKVEKSFASKMLHTLDPELPIIDREVLKKLKMPGFSPYGVWTRRRAIDCHRALMDWYATALADPVAIDWIDAFDKAFPAYSGTITPLKKIDFILWKL